MIKINKKYIVYSIVSFVFFGFGIALQLKADIGQSILNALAVTLSDTVHMKVGTVLNAVNSLFFVAYLLLRHSRLNYQDAVQVIATIANGSVINFFLYNVLSVYHMENYIYRLMLYFIGLIIASFSLGAILAIGIIKFPLESLCLTISEKYTKKFTAVRMTFDVIFLIAALCIALLAHTPVQIREGTVISILLLSALLGICLEFFKKHLIMEEL